MKNTHHANTRSKQRGVPPLIVDLLLQFGAREHVSDGLEILYFDQRSKKQLHSYAGNLIGKLNEQLDSYAMISGGTIVTVGARYKRIRHA